MARPVGYIITGDMPSVEYIRLQYTRWMTVTTIARPGRNELCHCGSGRKYKHCCLEKDNAEASAARKAAANTRGFGDRTRTRKAGAPRKAGSA